MLLEQFINSMAIGIAYPVSSSAPFSMNCTDGIVHKFHEYPASMGSASSSAYTETTPPDGFIGQLMSKIGIIVGSGTTPPTYSDYKMENSLAEALTFSNNTVSKKARVQILTQSVTNPTGESITINEVGVFGYAMYGCYLLTRSIISPIVLGPNETKTFTVKIDFNKFSEAYSVS